MTKGINGSVKGDKMEQLEASQDDSLVFSGHIKQMLTSLNGSQRRESTISNGTFQILCNKHTIYKLICLGDYETGKTSFIKRFVVGDFKENYGVTIGGMIL